MGWLRSMFLGHVGLVALAAGAGAAAPPACSSASAHLTHDYSYVVGSAAFVSGGQPESGSSYRWPVDDVEVGSGQTAELLLLHFDGSVNGEGGEVPATTESPVYVSGKWGTALDPTSGGELSYALDGNLNLGSGTIGFWLAPRSAGSDPVYASSSHTLFQYRAPTGDSISIAQAKDTGVLYAGGSVDGQWQSAYSLAANTRGWAAGEWHHVAYTYSSEDNSMRFYLDGSLVADSNEHRYAIPAAGSETFFIGSNVWGTSAAYYIDEMSISGRVAGPAEIAARAQRSRQPAPQEVWLPTTTLQPGSEVRFEYTPAAAGEQGVPCTSDPIVYPGVPVFDPSPPSTVLGAGSDELRLEVASLTETQCGFAVGEATSFENMTPFDSGPARTSHTTLVRGIATDPNQVTDVYVRCESHSDFLMHLRYRCLSEANPSFPRTGNLWGSRAFQQQGMEYASRIDLWLGASLTPSEIRRLREINPDIQVLTSINAIENRGLPEDYYLKDVTGRRIEVWPGSYRLNLTKDYVAEHQARYAYERVLASDLMFDGCFFDNVMTTQSWLTSDIYGRPVQIDANEDGQPDDPEEFDRAWKAGVFHELRTFRELMPFAVVNGHSTSIREPGITDIFNGTSVGFWTTDVIEGKRRFADLFDRYSEWNRLAVEPRATMIESAPPDQIAYGYDYSPRDKIPASTLEFARTYYPYVRFGLAFTLLDDGYFAHEFGDMWHGNDWWYDELDYDLGYPLGRAKRVELGDGPGPDIIENGSFEQPMGGTWRLWASSNEGCAAAASQDQSDAAVGQISARIDITSTSGTDWHVGFAQYDRALTGGAVYQLKFFAKADFERTLRVSAQKGSPDWRGYGLGRDVTVGTEWQAYDVSFEATESTTEARIQFLLGKYVGTVWLDDVRLQKIGPDVFSREYEHGLVVLNGSRSKQTVSVGPGFTRLSGDQAARLETIVDDGLPAFSCTGNCRPAEYESGEWRATGPFYHDWGSGCHQLSDSGEARWTLPIDASDAYTVTAWWPAAPEAAGWGSAVFDVVADGLVVATATLDQSSGGDEWHLIGAPILGPDQDAFVKIACVTDGPCIADALHVRSRVRLNDGSPAESVQLQPMDGIILSRSVKPTFEVFVPMATR